MISNIRPAALALLLCAAPATADLKLTWKEAVLGHALHYELEGDPGEFYIWIPSLQAGPVCLCLFDPLDPRELGVGLDLITLAQTGVLSVGGAADQLIPLPASPGLAGVNLYMQALTLPGTTTQVDDLSNPAKLTLSLPGTSQFTTSEMNTPRRFAPATTLLDGRVLITGGLTPAIPPVPLNSVELFDPQTQSFEDLGAALPEARGRHTQTLLEDGRVLLVGGVDAAGVVMDSAVIFDPLTTTFSATAPMNRSRVLHSATQLSNGTVLVIGGSSGFDTGHPVGYPASVTDPANATSEIYDPVNDVWTLGAALPDGLLAHSAVRLSDNRVVVAGGVVAPGGGITPLTTDASWIFNATGTNVLPTGVLPARRYHMGASPLSAAGALVVGGTNVDFATLVATVHVESFIFNEQQEIWGPGPPLPGGTRCGELNCVDFVKTLTEVGPLCPVPPCEIQCNVYFTGGGWDDINMSSGVGTPNTDFYQLNSTLSGWTSTTTSQAVRPGMTMAPIDGGLRFLIIGSADNGLPQRDKSAEIVVPIL